MPEDRGGSIQERVTLVFKTFDTGQVHMHSILHLFFSFKKIPYKTDCLEILCPKI